MKVLDLQCSRCHRFEGWFGSQDDYDAQRAQGLVTCPVCNDSEIVKMLSAPRLNLGHGLAPKGSLGQGEVRGASKASSGVNSAVGSVAGAAVSGELPLPGQSLASPRHDLSSSPDALTQIQAAMLNMVRHVMSHSEDVGPQFAEEARKIHYGESKGRHIRGQATQEETEALLDEGIEVMVLPVPENLKGPLQ